MAISLNSSVTISQINGSVSRGGWECRLKVMSDTDLLARWREINATWRGAFGGPFGAERAAFNGWVLPASSRFDVAGSETDAIAQTTDGFLRRGWCQGIGFAEVAARAHYHQFNTVGAKTPAMDEWMTLGKIVAHILGYYDNEGAPPVTNPDWVAHTNHVFHPVGNPHGWIALDNVELEDSAHVTRYIVRETDNLWTRLREIANNEFYFMYFDKTDTLWYKPHPMFQVALPDPVMTFDAAFVAAAPVVTYHDQDTLRQVKLHAVTDDGDTLHSDYPVSPTHTYGNVLDISRIRCNVQATLDSWAERTFLFENRAYTVKWTAPGLCGLLFELLDRVQITYTGTLANGVHFDWLEKKFWIHDISVVPGEGFGGHTEFTLEEENVAP